MLLALTTLFTLYFIDTINWRGIFAVLGVGALVVFTLRVSLPESPRWLATHGRGDEALAILKKMGLNGPRSDQLLARDGSDVQRDPLLIVFRSYPFRLFAGTVCFMTFFGGAVGLSIWLPT